MTDKELRKLSRVELLEMLVELSKQNEGLQNQLKEQEAQHQARIEEIEEDSRTRIAALQKQLEDKKVAIGKAGSIAEACLQINGIFEAAQASAEQYLVNVRNQEALCQEMEKATEEKASKRLADVEIEAHKYLEESRMKADQMLADAKQQSERTIADAKEKSSAYWEMVSQRLAGFYQEHQGLKELLNFNGGYKNQ